MKRDADTKSSLLFSRTIIAVLLGIYFNFPILVGISELFASVVSLEIAFTMAPKNMRSLVMAVGLFMTAIGSAIQEALIPLTKDPLLVWMYTTVACITFVAGVLFAIMYRGIDRESDYLNNLKSSHYIDPNKAHGEAWDMEKREQNHTPSEKDSKVQ